MIVANDLHDDDDDDEECDIWFAVHDALTVVLRCRSKALSIHGMNISAWYLEY